MQLSDIDLLDRDRFTNGIPHEWFTFLRHEAPVYKHPEPGGPGFWVLTKYADVVAVGRDAETFSSHQQRGGVVGLEGTADDYGGFEGGGNLMLTMDPPEHTRYRKLVNRGFTPRQMRMLEPHIRDLTNRILDEVIERGECESICRGPRIAPWRLVGVASLRRQQRFNSGSNRRSFGLRIGLGQFAQMPIDESGIELPRAKFRMAHQRLEERRIGMRSNDDGRAERSSKP